MNTTIEVLNTHRSVRSFKDEELTQAELNSIVEAAYHAPTSINGQQVSVVVVRDPQKKKEIAKIAGGQPWIEKASVFFLFVMDFYKTSLGVEKAQKKQLIHESSEALIVGGVDAGIALGRAMVAAQALGLGVVPIGGIRNDPQAMIDLLNLPPMTFPLAGMCVGKIDKNADQKPRLPLASFRHEEAYHKEGLKEMIENYDKTLVEHWKKTGRSDGVSWSESISAPYSKIYFPKVKPVLEKQGFTHDK